MRKNLLFCFVLFLAMAAKAGMRDLPPDSGKIVCRDLSSNRQNTLVYRKAMDLIWQKKGYLLAHTDSISPTRICILTGEKMDSVFLIYPKGNTWDTVFSKAAEIGDRLEEELQRLENNGYPFGKVRLVPTDELEHKVSFRMLVQSGSLYYLDSVNTGAAAFSPRLMKRAAGVRAGMVYDHSKLLLLQTRLSALDGFSLTSTKPELTVLNGKLIAKPAITRAARDQLNGLVGVATNPDGKVLFTGEVMGHFYNLFKSGSSASFEWRSFKARSQELRLSAGLPYIFGAPFITHLQLSLEKYDTLYTIFSRGFQLRFPISARTSLIGGAMLINRTRIFADELIVKNQHRLPDNPGSRNELFQFGLQSSNLVPGKIPTKGYRIKLMGHAGFRSYIQDATIAAITWTNAAGNQENVYDSLKRTGNFRTPQSRLEYDLAGFVPASRNLVFKFAAMGFRYHAPVVYFNELTRFGGIKNIRGFNEQSIFANQMHSAAIELHFVAGNAGYVGPFYNIAWYRNQSTGNLSGQGMLQGAGIVSGIRTGAGILQIIWAVGKTDKQPFALNNSKFHFGISNSF